MILQSNLKGHSDGVCSVGDVYARNPIINTTVNYSAKHKKVTTFKIQIKQYRLKHKQIKLRAGNTQNKFAYSYE